MHMSLCERCVLDYVNLCEDVWIDYVHLCGRRAI